MLRCVELQHAQPFSATRYRQLRKENYGVHSLACSIVPRPYIHRNSSTTHYNQPILRDLSCSANLPLTRTYILSIHPNASVYHTCLYTPGIYFFAVFFPLFFCPPALAPTARLWYAVTMFCTDPMSCLALRMYVSLARLALFSFLWTTSTPSTFGE